jgi:hypothetical protein
VLAVVVVLVAIGALALLSLRPPSPLPATAPDSVFSAGRAWQHLEAIASEPRPHGSPAHERVRGHLIESLQAIGLEVRVQASAGTARGSGAGEQDIVLRNVVALMPGTNPTGTVALVTHYDSHPRAAGAGDDGLGVSAVLEAARVLRTRPALRNDVLLLFTDGEEMGLLGARLFAERDPAAPDVRVVLNFEGRGSAGPALMFETGPGNAELVRIFQRADPRPIGSSLFPEAYRYLPNDTDFSVFVRAGIRGLNFAHIDRAHTYHRETDVPANASRATLQHHGDHAVAMTRAFGELDLATLPGPASADAIYFNAPGLGLVRYPAALAVPHAVAVVLLFAGAVLLVRRDAAPFVGIFTGFGLSIAALIVCAAAGWVATRLAATEAEAGTLVGKFVLREGPYMLAILAVALASVLVPLVLAARWFQARALALGVALTLVLLGVVAALAAPGASYLLLWPVAFSIAASCVVARPPDSALRDAVLVTVLLAPAVALWAPHLSLFLTGLSLRAGAALGVIAALACMTLAPVATLARR